MKICGFFGLKNKRELWRVQLLLSRIRKAARLLLTLDLKDPKRIFEGEALTARLLRLGVLGDEKANLDYVLNLTAKDFLKMRLQSKVAEKGIAKSLHHARILVRHGHIAVNNRKVNIPSFMVHVDSQRHIEFDVNSALTVGGKPGRVKKRSLKAGKGKAAEDE